MNRTSRLVSPSLAFLAIPISHRIDEFVLQRNGTHYKGDCWKGKNDNPQAVINWHSGQFQPMHVHSTNAPIHANSIAHKIAAGVLSIRRRVLDPRVAAV
jgi:hypothetical protein